MSTTAVSSSSSPAASPRAAFHHPSPRASFASSQRPPATTSRGETRPYTSNPPRNTLNAPAAASGTQHPKQRSVDSSPEAGSAVRYVDASTQYSPDALPPTAGGKVAVHAGKPPGSPKASSSARKRKEVTTSDPALESMSGASAASGAPQALAHSVPEEPQLRSDPVRAGPSNEAAEIVPEEARSTHGHSAAPKRSRPEGTLKMMPLKYETCNPKDLGVLVSNMLMELIRINDRIPLRDGRLTRFHSRAPPGISVSDYLQRLIQHATLSPPILLSMVYYIDRLCTLYPAFTINSLTVHRFLITAATVAAKGLSDSFWTNPTYARIGGIPVSELATLELELLQRVQWKIVPKPEVLEEYYNSLVDRTDGFTIEASSLPSSTSTSSSSLHENEEAHDGSDENKTKDGDELMDDEHT